jgi:hypothetical protein
VAEDVGVFHYRGGNRLISTRLLRCLRRFSRLYWNFAIALHFHDEVDPNDINKVEFCFGFELRRWFRLRFLGRELGASDLLGLGDGVRFVVGVSVDKMVSLLC